MKIKLMGKFLKLIMPDNVRAITLSPFGIYVRDIDILMNEKTINHEKIHWKQQMEMLIVFFYIWYLIEYIIRYFYQIDVYRNISFEKEAYSNDKNFNYLNNRKKFSWLNYLKKNHNLKMELKRNELKSGDVLHCTSNGWLGKLIQKFTKSRINHSAIVIEVWGEIFIIDSQKDGTNLRPIDAWNKMFNYTYKISRPKYFTIDLRSRAVSKIGSTSYDFISLFLWQPIYILTGKWHGHTRRFAEDKMYCSEYVSWVYSLNNWWENSPEEVYEILLKDPRFELINLN